MSQTDPDWFGLAGWNQQSAELTLLHRVGQHALAIFVTKSKPARFELAVFTADRAGVWLLAAEGADVGTDGQFGWAPTCVYGWGQSQPHTQLHVRYRRHSYVAAADSAGWWAFLHDVDPTAGDLLVPELITPK